jgi:hypothetical protein
LISVEAQCRMAESTCSDILFGMGIEFCGRHRPQHDSKVVCAAEGDNDRCRQGGNGGRTTSDPPCCECAHSPLWLADFIPYHRRLRHAGAYRHCTSAEARPLAHGPLAGRR